MTILELFHSFNPYEFRLQKPYVIAEAGVNHEGQMDLARRLIEEAQEGGADAIKFQSYKAETIASKNSPFYWDITKEPTRSQYELFKKYDKFWKKEFEALKKHCDEVKIEFMSTPFDMESADFLNDLMDVYKISSSDITNKPFIEYIGQYKKPIILSTGASNLSEIKEAKDWIDKSGNLLALLHCVLNYPTEDENANLGRILGLKKAFPNNIIGYSDHTLPGDMRTLEIATLLGANIIEKHFTFDKSLPGNDHYHAMNKDDLKGFCDNIGWILNLIGSYEVEYLPSEELARKNARRSLVAKMVIKKGELFTKDNIMFKRPGTGRSPRDIDTVIGSKAERDYKEDELI